MTVLFNMTVHSINCSSRPPVENEAARCLRPDCRLPCRSHGKTKFTPAIFESLIITVYRLDFFVKYFLIKFMQQEAQATKKPKPTLAPKPTAKPKPTRAPKPTLAPKPSVKPKPSVAPRPTKKPAPTRKPRDLLEDELRQKTRAPKTPKPSKAPKTKKPKLTKAPKTRKPKPTKVPKTRKPKGTTTTTEAP
jgi:hypothetical protein